MASVEVTVKAADVPAVREALARLGRERDWFASLAAGFATILRHKHPGGSYHHHIEELCRAWGAAKMEIDPAGTAYPDAEFLPDWPVVWRRHLEGWLVEHGRHIEEVG